MKIAFGCFRSHPPHEGHRLLFQKMLDENDDAILGLGSTNQPLSGKNPLPLDVRVVMWKNMFPNIKIVFLDDIGSNPSTDDWEKYCITQILNAGYPKPTEYYSGSTEDSKYIHNLNIHIVNRLENDIPSATMIREMIVENNNWEKWIPEINHDLIYDNLQFFHLQ